MSTGNNGPGTWNSGEQLDFWKENLEANLIKGTGPVYKLTYMLMRGPGGPVFLSVLVLLILIVTDKMTERYFFGVIALGVTGALALAYRGNNNGT